MRDFTQFCRPAIAVFAVAVFSFVTTSVDASIPAAQASSVDGTTTDPGIETPSPRAWPRSIQRGDAVLVLQRPQLDLWKGDRLTALIATSKHNPIVWDATFTYHGKCRVAVMIRCPATSEGADC